METNERFVATTNSGGELSGIAGGKSSSSNWLSKIYKIIKKIEQQNFQQTSQLIFELTMILLLFASTESKRQTCAVIGNWL